MVSISMQLHQHLHVCFPELRRLLQQLHLQQSQAQRLPGQATEPSCCTLDALQYRLLKPP